MTREEAIKIISQMIKDEEGFLSDNTVEAHKMAIKALEQEPRWIPVSERLPEYDEDIIITYKGTMGQSVTNVSYFDGDFRTEDGEGYFGDVIAWMPLPEPYKVDKEEEE